MRKYGGTSIKGNLVTVMIALVVLSTFVLGQENTATTVPLQKLVHDGYVNSVAFSPDGSKLATGSSDSTARIWDVATGKELGKFVHDSSVEFVALSPDGRKLATWVASTPGSSIGEFHLWDVVTEKELMNLITSGAPAFSPDGHKLVLNEEYEDPGKVFASTADVIDADTGEKLLEPVPNTGVRSVALSPDGSKLAMTFRGGMPNILICDSVTGKTLQQINDQDVGDYVMFSPDGAKLYDFTSIWDVATGKKLQEISSGDHPIAFSPDGSKLAMGDEDPGHSVRIWDVATGTKLEKLAHDGYVNSVAFSPDGSKLATGSSDSTARIWDVATGIVLQKLVHDGSVVSVEFSPDGSKLATLSSDTVRIWAVAT